MTWLTRRYFLACFVLTCSLVGCGPEPKAPEPTVNPHPHKFTRLKISVEPGSSVNNVEVTSIWAIGNIACAPIRPFSGSSVQEEVRTKERVRQINANTYLATVMDDRFVADRCHWNGNVYEIRFKHDQTLLAVDAESKNDLVSGAVKLTCVSKDDPPTCWPRSREAFFRSHFKGVFNATVEIEQ